MIRPVTFIFLLFALPLAKAQKSDTLRLYFEINQTEVHPHKARIDSAFKSGTLSTVQIIGFADYLSTSDYNISLSQRRADNIKALIQNSFPQAEIISSKGKGEANSRGEGKEGEARQRRVDIIITPKSFSVTMEDQAGTSETKKTGAAKKDGLEEKVGELKVGESIEIEGLSFEPGRHFLLKESGPSLKKLLETLQKYPKLKVEIQGHVCCTNDGEDGLDIDTRERNLSENRAKAVYDYLVKNGIRKSRLTHKGYARTQPKSLTESTPEEEQMNRRVEIKVIEK
jgi:outer membrane protein OmpA-like peptidoglycan-associated protein